MSEPQKVLIIDDEEDIRELARISLERVGGLQVLVAASGPEGLKLAASEHPDAIVLDAMMPGMDGPETLTQLKADSATEQIPVVFLTGSVQAAERDRFKSLGAAGLLPKPFDPMRLADDLRSCLGWS
ncbi:MAG TPA: response regulator [Thermoleophilaceae bacterium]|jgi:CheY-like chemotaxis protein|nr:response regulator [Thermoleophilaceae bacterium]